MQGKAADLEAIGHKVVARWISGFQEAVDKTDDLKAVYAQQDLDDIKKCDALILFGEPEGTAVRGGGRFFELGYAYSLGLLCCIVGGREHVFCHLPSIRHFDQWQECLDFLEHERP